MIRPGIRRLFRLPNRSGDLADQELDEEIRLHLELRAEQLERQGLGPDQARAEALRRFGPPVEARRLLRRAAQRRERRLRVREWLEGLRQDVHYAVRSLGKSPGFTTVIVLTLALGIGLCTSIYSVVRGVILDPIPFPDSHQLLAVEIATQGSSGIPLYSDFLVWSAQTGRVADIAGYTLGSRRIGYEHRTVEAFSVRVTDDFFGVLRARPLLGRTLVPSDASAASEPAAVVSHHLWRDLLGADSAAVGRSLHVGGRTYSLVGVLEPGQEFPAPVDVWTPLVPSPEELGALHVTVVGRLKPGATRDEARLTIETVHRSLAADRGPEEAAGRAEILPLTGRQNEAAGIVTFLLALSVGSILLIGIANAAGLVLTRTLARGREIAIRAALGAGRLRIAALLLTEALLVAVAAAGVGLLIAYLVLAGFQRGMPEELSRQVLGWEQLGLDAHVAGFAVLLALIAGLGCSLVPALGAARPNLVAALQQGSSAATPGPRRRRVLRALVIGEVSLSVVLLLCAGLVSRSLLALVGQEPGFATDGIAAVRWSIPGERDTPPDARLRVQQALVERAEGVPGIASATLASDLPATREGFGATRTYEFEGSDPGRTRGRAHWRAVSPGYLESVRVPILQGRAFESSDGSEAPRVAIVSEALARARSQRGQSVLGSEISVGDERWTVVGVAGNVRSPGASTGPEATIYVPHAQAPSSSGYLVVRLAAPLPMLAGSLRDEAWRVDSAIALGRVRTLQEVIDELVAEQRIVAALVTVYAATALLITLISLYAIVAHLVVQHRRDHGILTALGASPGQIVRSAMRKALIAAVAGTVIGTAVAAGLARLIASLLYGVTPLEPLVFGVLPILLLGIFALAVYLPARTAARVDPMTSLRT
jgi:predicted permease